jgi:3-hydroxyacyl-CoA dehydrogenase
MLDTYSTSGSAVVIGAGTMGGGIAAQLANAGWSVRLLDVASPSDPKTRNAVADAGLDRVRRNRPPLLFLPEFAERIRTGNVEDDIACVTEADWVVEAVAERVDVKQALMAQIERYAGPRTVVSSNTSALSLHEMTAGCRPAFRARFLGTHFLNPPRYLKLLEVVRLPQTDPEVFAGFVAFAEQILGHRVVEARDTPGFISTRLWITHLMDTMHLALRHGLSVEEVDYLTGSLLGRPRSATFRMADLVGLDIVANIAANQYAALPSDPYRDRLLAPEPLRALAAAGHTGDKADSGFYRREASGRSVYDLTSGDYRPEQRIIDPQIEELVRLDLPSRLARLRASAGSAHAGGLSAFPETASAVVSHNPAGVNTLQDSRYGRFLTDLLDSLETYVQTVGPEIAHNPTDIDRVMRWGFGWEMGPNEMAQARQGARPSVIGSAADSGEYATLSDLKQWPGAITEDDEAGSITILDGTLILEFRTKMNTFSPALTALLDRARTMAEERELALVIANDAPHFSAGYNLKLFVEAVDRQDWAAIDEMIDTIQHAFLALRQASVPVVAAPHGYTLGAGCECCLHCAAVQSAPELSMGLPEVNVGLIPTGGGVTQILLRHMAGWDGNSDPYPRVEAAFDLLTSGKISSNAHEARKLGLLREEDPISRNADRQFYEARQLALSLRENGYRRAEPDRSWIMGPDGLARLRMRIHNHYRSGVWSEHDRLIADRIAYVLTGGDVPFAQEVGAERLLTLERQVFIALMQTEKTVQRMRHMLETGKPLRN